MDFIVQSLPDILTGQVGLDLNPQLNNSLLPIRAWSGVCVVVVVVVVDGLLNL